MHENQKKILDYLLDHPEGGTLDDLSWFLGISKTATKEHVIKLTTMGHLTFKDVSGHVGRPKRHYRLTESGQEVFPRRYSWLAIMLLKLLTKNIGPDEVSAIMDELADEITSSMSGRLSKLQSQSDRIKEITLILNELGYRARTRQSDLRKGAIIEATNCVYHTVAKAHPELCRFDVGLIEKMGGHAVKLDKCIARGDGVCRFCISAKKLDRDHSV